MLYQWDGRRGPGAIVLQFLCRSEQPNFNYKLESRTVIIDMKLHAKLGAGVYSDVFSVNGKACKLFKSGPEVPPRQTREGRKRVYLCQVEAYRRTAVDPELQSYLPTFYGPCAIDDVVDEGGKSVREDYLLDACYSLQVLEGQELKLVDPDVARRYPKVPFVRSQLKALGVETLDASVFCLRDTFKIIDIDIELC